MIRLLLVTLLLFTGSRMFVHGLHGLDNSIESLDNSMENSEVPVIILDEGLLQDVAEFPAYSSEESSAQFRKKMEMADLRSEVLVLFIEDRLSMEDIGAIGDKDTPYFYMMDAIANKKGKLLERVVEPFSYLKKRFASLELNTHRILSSTTQLLLDDPRKVLYVLFEDVTNETRTQRLRRHDIIVQQVLKRIRLRLRGAVVGVYTGREGARRGGRGGPHSPWQEVSCRDSSSFKFKLLGHDGAPVRVAECLPERSALEQHWKFLLRTGLKFDFYLLFTFIDPNKKDKGWRLTRVYDPAVSGRDPPPTPRAPLLSGQWGRRRRGGGTNELSHKFQQVSFNVLLRRSELQSNTSSTYTVPQEMETTTTDDTTTTTDTVTTTTSTTTTTTTNDTHTSTTTTETTTTTTTDSNTITTVTKTTTPTMITYTTTVTHTDTGITSTNTSEEHVSLDPDLDPSTAQCDLTRDTTTSPPLTTTPVPLQQTTWSSPQTCPRQTTMTPVQPP